MPMFKLLLLLMTFTSLNLYASHDFKEEFRKREDALEQEHIKTIADLYLQNYEAPQNFKRQLNLVFLHVYNPTTNDQKCSKNKDWICLKEFVTVVFAESSKYLCQIAVSDRRGVIVTAWEPVYYDGLKLIKTGCLPR